MESHYKVAVVHQDTVIPHDPSYNYLKDPSRENVDDCVQEPHKQVNTRKHNKVIKLVFRSIF